MIINTGGRTDTVQYYTDWLMRRFDEAAVGGVHQVQATHERRAEDGAGLERLAVEDRVEGRVAERPVDLGHALVVAVEHEVGAVAGAAAGGMGVLAGKALAQLVDKNEALAGPHGAGDVGAQLEHAGVLKAVAVGAAAVHVPQVAACLLAHEQAVAGVERPRHAGHGEEAPVLKEQLLAAFEAAAGHDDRLGGADAHLVVVALGPDAAHLAVVGEHEVPGAGGQQQLAAVLLEERDHGAPKVGSPEHLGGVLGVEDFDGLQGVRAGEVLVVAAVVGVLGVVQAVVVEPLLHRGAHLGPGMHNVLVHVAAVRGVEVGDGALDVVDTAHVGHARARDAVAVGALGGGLLDDHDPGAGVLGAHGRGQSGPTGAHHEHLGLVVPGGRFGGVRGACGAGQRGLCRGRAGGADERAARDRCIHGVLLTG